jgi:uncharacterized protein (DUF983 family)
MLPRCPQCGQETPASALFRSNYKCEACDAELEVDTGAASIRLVIMMTIVALLSWFFPFGVVVVALPILLLAFLRGIPLKVRE